MTWSYRWAVAGLVLGLLGCGSARPQPVPDGPPIEPGEPGREDAGAGDVRDGDAAADAEDDAAVAADDGGVPSEVVGEVVDVGSADLRQVYAMACDPAQPNLDPAACGAAATALTSLIDLTPEERAAATATMQRMAQWNTVDPRAIGVLLPLTGDYATLGKVARAALELAFEGASELKLIVRDTVGDPAKAASEAERLVLEDHVVAVLGPVGRKETAAALDVLRRYHVPVLALASVMPAAAPGVQDATVKTRAAPEDYAMALAKHARSELGLSRLAILRPASDAAQELAAAVAAAFVRLGGTLVREVPYDASTKDFHGVVKQLLGAAAGDKRPTKLTPKPDFDALFMPEQALVIRRLGPFLRFWGVMPKLAPGGKGVQFLGAAGWDQSSIIDPSERTTENAVFVDAIDPSWADPAAADFVRRHMARGAGKPSAFDAEAFDAATLLRDALGTPLFAPDVLLAPTSAGEPPSASAGHALRLALRARLGVARIRPGATGVIVVVDGRVLPRVAVLTVAGDTIRRRLSEAAERDQRTQQSLPAPKSPEQSLPHLGEPR